ncbi:MAG: BMP family ABC transporter substrate-binding protein [Chloroflexota bacterium]|nr:BMP family ABC transporter substrate-binding protein [Chloroflexota bacterium]
MNARLFSRAVKPLALALILAPVLAACGGAADTPTTVPDVPTTAPTAMSTTDNTPTAMMAVATTAAMMSPTAGALMGDTPTAMMTGGTPSAGMMGTPGAGKQLKVGLVTDVGRLNDKSFNQSSWEGVVQAQQQLGIDAKNIETADPKDYDKNIQQFVGQNYDVIVTVGFALADATTKAAKANPNIKFIGVDQFQAATLPNLAGLIFEEDKAGYLAGALAASISKSGTIGAVCGTDDVPPVWRYGEGYKAGAKSVNPNVKVLVTYHSDVDISKTFNDPDWGKTTALSMIDKGADVVFGAGGNTGNGAIYAAKDKSIAAIGVDSDQYGTIGDQYKGALVSSAMKLLTPGVFGIIKSVQDSSFKGGNNTGTVGLAPFHDMDAKVGADVKTKLQSIDAGLKDGTIKTCVSPAKGAPSPCGAAGSTPAAGATTAGKQLKVGLVTDVGRLNDKSFNQSSWEGVVQAQQQLGIDAKNIETADPKDYDKNIQQFVGQNYDVIVTVGFALADATTKAAKANPNIKFIGVDQFQAATLPNLAGLVFEEDKAGYLAGALAASISKSGTIGAVCGTDDVPPVWRYGEGYKAGAKSINPNVKVLVTYHSDVDISKTFNDPDWGKTTALSMIDKGADVVFGAGGNTGNGAIYAAKDKGIAAIGVDSDQYGTIGDQYKGALVSSAMKLLTPGVFGIIKSVQDSSFKGGNNTGTVGLAPFHDMDAKVGADVKTKLQSIDAGLKDGTVKTCVSPAKGAPSPCGATGSATGSTPAAGVTTTP